MSKSIHMVLGALSCAMLGLAFAGPVSAADDCPNAQIRAQQHATYLPDCRAYEQVSLPDKASARVLTMQLDDLSGNLYQTSTNDDGTAASYLTSGGVGDAVSAEIVEGNAAFRTSGDRWDSLSATILDRGRPGKRHGVMAYSGDLTRAIVRLSDSDADSLTRVRLARYDLGSKAYAEILPNDGLEIPFKAEGTLESGYATPELDTVLFQDVTPYTSDAPAGVPSVYAAVGDRVELVSVLPDPDGDGPAIAQPAPDGAQMGALTDQFAPKGGPNVLSANGDRAFFTTPDGRLFVRFVTRNRTVQVNASRRSTPDTPEQAVFRTATSDGRYVVFTTTEQLTDDDVNEMSDHYRFDTETEELDRVSKGEYVPDFWGAYTVGGISEDGQSVVFVAGGPAYPATSAPADTFLGVYCWCKGSVRYIGEESYPGGAEQLSENGRGYAFTSSTSQAGFATGGLDQIWYYDLLEGKLSCASCPPGGKPATAVADMPRASLEFSASGGSTSTSRAITRDGTMVFFTSGDALVPQDTNGQYDAYEFVDGQSRLLSSGRDPRRSLLVNVSRDGETAYFSTAAQLLPSDREETPDLYAARIGGGAAQSPPGRVCSGDDCQGPIAAPPVLPSLGSISFVGNGNAPLLPDPMKASVGVSRLKAIPGSAAKLRVRVPDAGRISVTGPSIRRSSASASKAGSYTLKVRLTSYGERRLRKMRRLRVGVRVSYRSTDGLSASKTVNVTFEQPKAKRVIAGKGGR